MQNWAHHVMSWNIFQLAFHFYCGSALFHRQLSWLFILLRLSSFFIDSSAQYFIDTPPLQERLSNLFEKQSTTWKVTLVTQFYFTLHSYMTTLAYPVSWSRSPWNWVASSAFVPMSANILSVVVSFGNTWPSSILLRTESVRKDIALVFLDNAPRFIAICNAGLLSW